ncbi:MAG: hypothetical protein AB8B85_20190, partial [Paracoccaceae bacterium]
AADISDLDIVNVRRKDGSVNWVEIRDPDGQAELAIRFTGAPLDAANLTAANFQFSGNAGAAPEIARQVDTAGLDDLRGVTGAEVFQMTDDGVRDAVRGFEQGLDLLDLRAFGELDFAALSFSDIYRKDGSVNWIELRDAQGDAELLLRLSDMTTQTADLLTADDFVFL